MPCMLVHTTGNTACETEVDMIAKVKMLNKYDPFRFRGQKGRQRDPDPWNSDS